ncbi:MAG: 50S ribosomal protein L33 [Bacteroidales bacterium]|nr:50S ribosomal protein L33 [Bacteroidales bacterium]
MAKKAKGNRVQVILESIEKNEEGKDVVSRYVTTKNKKNTPERIERKKYHAGVKRVTVHKEIK